MYIFNYNYTYIIIIIYVSYPGHALSSGESGLNRSPQTQPPQAPASAEVEENGHFNI